MNDDTVHMTDDLEVVVRRSPRYGSFLVAGIVLGFIIAGILVMLPVDMTVLTSEYSTSAALGLLMFLLGLTGAAAGAGVALILDRMNARKVRTYTVRGEYEARPAKRDGSSAPDHGRNGDGPEVLANEDGDEDAGGTGASARDAGAQDPQPDDDVKQ